MGNTTLIYGEGLFSWDLSFGLTVESVCSFLLGQIFGQLVGHSIDLLLILPATHAFCEMFLKLCANLGSHFCDMEYVMIFGER